MIAEFIQLAKIEPDKAIEYLLRFVEETIPTKSVFIRESEQGVNTEPFEETNLEVVKLMIKQIYKTQIATGKNVEQVKLILASMEPFNNFPELIEIVDSYE